MTLQARAFFDIPVGSVFYWGAYKEENMNWGHKRSTRTADWCPKISGEYSAYTTWGYFGQNELVYVPV